MNVLPIPQIIIMISPILLVHPNYLKLFNRIQLILDKSFQLLASS